jgi:hypothetical protein
MRYALLLLVSLTTLAASASFCLDDDADDFSDMLAEAEASESEVTEAGADGSSLRINGDTTFRLTLPLCSDPWTYSSYASAPEAALRVGLEYGYEQVHFRSDWYAMVRPEPGETPPASVDGRPGVQELEYDGEGFSIAAGLLEINWGSADGVNPTDVLNPRDYSALPEPEKLPVPALQVKWFPITRIALEGVYIPYRGSDQLPFEAEEVFPADLAVSTKHPEFSPASAVAAGRITAFLKNLDLSVMYAFSFDPYYTPRFHSYSFIPAPTAGCELFNGRVHTVGLDIRGAVNNIGYWLEGAYSHTVGFDQQDYWFRSPMFDLVAGFDVRFGRDHMWYANLQLRGRYLPYFDEDYFGDYPGGVPDMMQVGDEAYMLEYYQRTFLYGLTEYRERILTGLMYRLSYENTVKVSLDGACFVPFGYAEKEDDFRFSMFVNPEIAYTLPGGFEVACGAILHGAWRLSGQGLAFNEEDPIGARKEENHIYLETRFTW